MPLYQYSAVDDIGESIRGRYTAKDKVELLQMIREKKCYPVVVKEVVEEKDIKSLDLFNKVKTKDIAVFCRQFYAMLNAGVTIIQCLDILRQQTENRRLKEVTGEIYETIQKGTTFSEALKGHRNIFPEILISMVEAGELSGTLDSVMDRMAVHFEKENRIYMKVKGAMVYPTVLSIVAVGVVAFLLTVVMPTFIGMFESSGVALPAPTRLLMAMSKGLQMYWYIILLVLSGGIYLLRRYTKTKQGKYAVDRLVLGIPVVNTTIKKVATSRFTRTLSTLLTSGIPLIQAMEIVEKVIGNKVIGEGISNVRNELRRGSELAPPIKRMGIFPPMVDSMIKIGEESGTLDEILEKTADFYDDEVEAALQKMTTLMEPVLIVFMGVVVGFIVISMALPMFDMVNTVK